MATWVNPIDTETDPDAPLTANLAKRFDNNIVAFYELDPSSPRLRVSVEADTAGSIVDPTVIDGLGTFGGVVLDGFIAPVSAGGACDIQLELSNDGVTYSAPTTIISIGASESLNGTFKLFVKLSDGVVRGAWQGLNVDPGAGSVAVTLPGGGASVSHIRVTATTATHNVYTLAQRVGDII